MIAVRAGARRAAVADRPGGLQAAVLILELHVLDLQTFLVASLWMLGAATLWDADGGGWLLVGGLAPLAGLAALFAVVLLRLLARPGRWSRGGIALLLAGLAAGHACALPALWLALGEGTPEGLLLPGLPVLISLRHAPWLWRRCRAGGTGGRHGGRSGPGDVGVPADVEVVRRRGDGHGRT